MPVKNSISHSRASAITVDVEDAVNQAMRNFFGRDMEPTFRVYENTSRLLDLFSEYNVSGTFFVLGEVAKTYPNLVKEISERGHELGIHGYSHARYFNLTREEARQEIISSKNLIEDISGQEVIGHRAPEFSINEETKWVLEILIEAGIKYDSSVYPCNSGRYGWPGFKKDIDWFYFSEGKRIIEAPLSVVTYLGKEIPVCGGGYLRVMPYFITDLAFKKVLNKRPVIVYIHPYEIDPPPFQNFYMNEVNSSSFKTRFKIKKYWFNRSSVLFKLSSLLGQYRFTTLRELINQRLNIDL